MFIGPFYFILNPSLPVLEAVIPWDTSWTKCFSQLKQVISKLDPNVLIFDFHESYSCMLIRNMRIPSYILEVRSSLETYRLFTLQSITTRVSQEDLPITYIRNNVLQILKIILHHLLILALLCVYVTCIINLRWIMRSCYQITFYYRRLYMYITF